MDMALDKRGKTEEEFLREYDVTKYFRPSVTVDAMLYKRLGADRIRLLMIKRGGHPFIGKYALPGGFVEEDEACEAAVLRELNEETNITGVPFRQLVTVSTPGRDPRWRNITVVYYGVADGITDATAGDDAAEAVWFDITRDGDTLYFAADDVRFFCRLDIKRDAFGKIDINNTVVTEGGRVAFDHAKLVCYLLEEIGGDHEN